MTFSLEDQIKCVQREISMRERVYPNWVVARKMSGDKAQLEIAHMRAVLATLEQVQRGRTFRREG
jgi:hypothetical protein